MEYPLKKTVSISIGVVMLLALSVSVSYLNITSGQNVLERLPMQLGYISLGLVGPILLGIFISAPWGVRLGQKMHVKWLRLIFGLVMVVLLVKTLWGLF